MAQRNDDELAFYLADLVRTAGHISDQERDWYLTQLSVAQPYTGPKHINDIWQAYWLSLGIAQGSVNDMAYAWLVSIGIPAGHINDMWHSYFDSAYPAVLDTALVWNDESTLVISGPDVTGWNNKGTGGALYDQIGRTNGSTGPQLGTFNGINVADLDTVIDPDRKFFTPAVGTVIAQPITIIVVGLQHSLPTQQHTLFDSMSGTPRVTADANNGNTAFNFSAGTSRSSGAGSYDILPHVFSVVFDGANSRFNVSDIGTFGPFNLGANDMTYGVLGANLNSAQTWDGWLSHYVVFDSVISDSDIDSIATYFRNIMGF